MLLRPRGARARCKRVAHALPGSEGLQYRVCVRGLRALRCARAYAPPSVMPACCASVGGVELHWHQMADAHLAKHSPNQVILYFNY